MPPFYDDDVDEDVIKTSFDDVLYNCDVGTMGDFETELVMYTAGSVVYDIIPYCMILFLKSYQNKEML